MPDNNPQQQQQQPDPGLAAFQARAQKNAANANAANVWTPQQGDPTHHIQVGDTHLLIHSDDLPEAQRRNPDLIVHGQVTSRATTDPGLEAFKRRLRAKEAGVPTAAIKPGAYQQTKEQAQAHIVHNVNEDAANPFSDTTTSVIGSTGAMMKRPDESDSQFMARAREAGRNVTQSQIDAENASNKRLAAPTAAIATAAGPAMLSLDAGAARALGMGAAEDMGLKEWVEQMGEKMPTTLDKAKEGLNLLKAAGEAHPLVKHAIIQGLTMLGVGKLAQMLGWLGKVAD